MHPITNQSELYYSKYIIWVYAIIQFYHWINYEKFARERNTLGIIIISTFILLCFLIEFKRKKSWKDRKIIRCLNIISRKLSFHDSIRLHKIRFPHPTFTNFASFSIIISPPPFRFSFLKNSTNSVLDILSTKTHRESERFESWGGGGYENGDERTTARNGCKLAAKAFSREARRGGRDDYGQLRYTHSVSPYRSIATGGSHFLANGCFHPPANAPSFPLTLSFHHRSFPFSLPPPFSRQPFLLPPVKFLSPIILPNKPLEFRVSSTKNGEERRQ